jgi:hypothetical protein
VVPFQCTRGVKLVCRRGYLPFSGRRDERTERPRRPRPCQVTNQMAYKPRALNKRRKPHRHQHAARPENLYREKVPVNAAIPVTCFKPRHTTVDASVRTTTKVQVPSAGATILRESHTAGSTRKEKRASLCQHRYAKSNDRINSAQGVLLFTNTGEETDSVNAAVRQLC